MISSWRGSARSLKSADTHQSRTSKRARSDDPAWSRPERHAGPDDRRAANERHELAPLHEEWVGLLDERSDLQSDEGGKGGGDLVFVGGFQNMQLQRFHARCFLYGSHHAFNLRAVGVHK